ncbi:TonB family protein [Tahibacter amnicola]|uniref:Protein TonB n=1 Tax=Tahibacter amnicola TaxID=2976241 RepID=A0ABY6BH77_9GAMM|nr:TonB family protein [Tahibacter amnicola]UXI69381.1 TonB family protein [Tahibacter amnicola]
MAARIEAPSARRSRGSALPKIIAALVVLGAAGGGVWFFFLRGPSSVTPTAQVTEAIEQAATTPVATTTAPADPNAAGKLNTLSVDQLFKEASTALNEQRLVNPPGNNALEFYLKILERDPGNSRAQDALRELFTFAASAAEQDINARNVDGANRVIELLTKADPNNYTLTILRSKLDAQRKIVEREAQQAQAAAEAAARRAAEPAATAARTPATATTAAPDASAATTTAATSPAASGTRPTTPTETATAAAIPPPPVAPATPAGGESRDAELVRQVPPQYPTAALRRRQEGWVQVEFTVTADGRVTNAHVLDSDPPRTFDRAALDAVQRWTFKPAVRNGGAIEATVKRRIEFKM